MSTADLRLSREVLLPGVTREQVWEWVNANERLDYFGNTVNHAARIEGQSRGADVVITEAVARDPEVVAILSGGAVVVSGFETALKGLTGTHHLTRLELPSRPAAAG